MTVDQLVHHTSGLPTILDPSTFIGLQLSSRQRIPSDFLRELSEYKLAFEPGAEFLYSNVGYTLLAVVLARAAPPHGRP